MRPKYKELYNKEKYQKEQLLEELDYYKQAIDYMNKKRIIDVYIHKIERNPYQDGFIEVTRLKVDNDFDFEYVKFIDNYEMDANANEITIPKIDKKIEDYRSDK